MTHSIEDLLDFALNGDVTAAKDAIDELMVSKINDAIEEKKLNLVNSTFNGIDNPSTIEDDDDIDELEDDDDIDELEDLDEAGGKFYTSPHTQHHWEHGYAQGDTSHPSGEVNTGILKHQGQVIGKFQSFEHPSTYFQTHIKAVHIPSRKVKQFPNTRAGHEHAKDWVLAQHGVKEEIEMNKETDLDEGLFGGNSSDRFHVASGLSGTTIHSTHKTRNDAETFAHSHVNSGKIGSHTQPRIIHTSGDGAIKQVHALGSGGKFNQKSNQTGSVPKSNFREETENLDELSKDTLNRYVDRTFDHRFRGNDGDAAQREKTYRKAPKRLQGLNLAMDKIQRKDAKGE